MVGMAVAGFPFRKGSRVEVCITGDDGWATGSVKYIGYDRDDDLFYKIAYDKRPSEYDSIIYDRHGILRPRQPQDNEVDRVFIRGSEVEILVERGVWLKGKIVEPPMVDGNECRVKTADNRESCSVGLHFIRPRLSWSKSSGSWTKIET